jgi:hypothetical protein
MDKKLSMKILIVILVMVIGAGAVVWAVYNQKKTDKQDEITKEETKIDSTTTTTTSDQILNQSYMEIKQWGVKIPITSNVGSLSYSFLDSAVVGIRSTELNKLSGDCTSNSVNVTRGKASDSIPTETGEAGEPGATFLDTYNSTSVDNNLSIRSIKAKVDEYYFVVPDLPTASCVSASQDTPEGQAKYLDETSAQVNIVRAINQLIKL